MSGAALGLVLGAGVAHVVWNVRLHAHEDRVPAMAVAGLVGGALLLPFAIADPPTEVAGLVVLTGFAEAAYALALSAAYARGRSGSPTRSAAGRGRRSRRPAR